MTVYPGVYSVSNASAVLGLGIHTNTGRSLERRWGHSRSVSQSFLKEKAVEHSELLKTCANGASKTNIVREFSGKKKEKDADK